MGSSDQSTNSEDSQVESAKIFQTRRSLFMSSSSSSESSERVSVDEKEKNGEEEEEEISGEESEVNVGDAKNGEEEGLNSRGDEKISISCLVDFIGKVLEKGRDDLREFFKELSKQNLITMSKLIDELLAENQRFPSNGKYGDCLICKNELIERISWINSMLLPSELKQLKRKWVEQEAVELEVASNHLALLQEELQMRLAKLRATRE
ncbi:hypothetical protein SUGI_1154090 [Cryptomeria japonica]|nr:hypothetical protein SUGI_1154090 [Cryptomeria japonica]